jgi:hypothetical protein
MFGVSFATLKAMVKRIKVDHDLALELWNTAITTRAFWRSRSPIRRGSRVGSRPLGQRDLHAGVRRLCRDARCGEPALDDQGARMARLFRRAIACLRLDSRRLPVEPGREDSDEWFAKRLAQIEKSIHSAPNAEREAMNMALITIGGRNTAMRKAATAAAKRIGKVEVDHGDTACKTPDAGAYLEKMWAHAAVKKFESPAAQERAPRIDAHALLSGALQSEA